MTGSKVLVVKLPELHADVKALEAFRAYVCDALGAGALVLPLGTTYAVEDFPALGAVEVGAGNVVPVVTAGGSGGPACTARASSARCPIRALHRSRSGRSLPRKRRSSLMRRTSRRRS